MRQGLWRDHEATPCQRNLVFGGTRVGRQTQADLILSLLRKARDEGRALALPEIMAVRIAQHGVRIRELRDRGFVIDNEQERSSDGRVLSRYWLRRDPELDGANV